MKRSTEWVENPHQQMKHLNRRYRGFELRSSLMHLQAVIFSLKGHQRGCMSVSASAVEPIVAKFSETCCLTMTYLEATNKYLRCY